MKPPSTHTKMHTHRRLLAIRLVIAAVAVLSFGFSPVRADNLTSKAGVTPILGLENGTISNDHASPVPGTYTDSGNGAAYAHYGNTAAIADGNPNSVADTFYDDSNSSVNSSYVGFSLTGLPGVEVSALSVSFHLYGDGGWFGVNNSRPGNDSTNLSSTYLVTPDLQVTYDGSSWVDVANTNSYVSILSNYNEDAGNTAPVTFTLNAPVSGIQGIRLVGTNGGTAGSGDGFIGVAEETLTGTVPEPSTYAMLLAGLGVLGLRVWRKGGLFNS